jgi:hypothetical protein
MSEPPVKIHPVDDYIKGLEEQGIVVFPSMRETIKRLNGHGVLDGYPAADEGLFPAGDPRYEAGHLDRERERQRQHEEASARAAASRIDKAITSGMFASFPGIMPPNRPIPYLAKFAIRDRVTMDGSDIVGTITETCFTQGAIGYRVSWMFAGEARSGYFDEFRLSAA